MTDNLSQDELDKLLAGMGDDAGGGGGDADGLGNEDLAKLEALFSAGWAQLANNMGQSLGRTVSVDFGVAANLPGESLASDLESLGVLIHFPVKGESESTHAIVLQADEVAKLGTVIGGGDVAEAALTAETFQAVLDFLDMSLPIVAGAAQEALGTSLEFGAVQGISTEDSGTEFDAAALGLDGPVVRLEYALTVGDEVTCPVLYTLPLASARELVARAPAPAVAAPPEPASVAEPARPTFAEFDSAQGGPPPGAGGGPENMDLILDIELEVVARLGSIQMPVREILKLGPGSIIDIDRAADAPVDLVVNEKLIAHGDIVVVQENFGLKISDVLSPQERIASLRQ